MTVQPGEPGTSREWDCAMCSVLNDPAHRVCTQCGTPRETGTGRALITVAAVFDCAALALHCAGAGRLDDTTLAMLEASSAAAEAFPAGSEEARTLAAVIALAERMASGVSA